MELYLPLCVHCLVMNNLGAASLVKIVLANICCGFRAFENGWSADGLGQDVHFVELTDDPAYTAVMNPDAQRWRELALYDLGTAEAMLTAGRYLYVLFCCQQTVEKYLKGLIVERCGIFPPRTHDLTKLVHVARIAPDDAQDLFLRTLTKYYIGTRYPEEVRILANEATRDLATHLLSQTKELLQWLETLPR